MVLGKWRLGDDAVDNRGLVYVPFEGGERNRLYLDPARATSIKVDAMGVKIEFLGSIHIGMS